MTSELTATRERLAAAEVETKQKIADIDARFDKEKQSRDFANAQAEINAFHSVEEAQIKLAEDRARRVFTKADMPAELEAAAKPLIEQTTKAYDDQIEKLRERAKLLESTIKLPGVIVTADLGTPDFEKQIDGLKKVAPEIYRQLLEMNTEEKRIRMEQSDAVEKIELQKTEKIKAIRAKEVEDQDKAIRDELIVEESSYRQDLSFIQELYVEKKLTLSEYTMTAKMFAAQELSSRIVTLDEERQALKAARDADILTEEQYNRRMQELATQQTRFQEQKEAKVSRLTKEEITKREQALHSSVTHMADEFASGINKMIQHEQSFGRSLAQMGAQIELSLIDNGIKRVTIHYGEEFAKMIAEHLGFITKFIADHSTFLATLLGIETTSKAAKAAAAKAADVPIVAADAGVSFAAGYASVMAALPFPANVAAAPGVAAEASSATFAGGMVFEKGGIMPEGHVPAFVRPQEAVLPVDLTKSLTGAIDERAIAIDYGDGRFVGIIDYILDDLQAVVA